MNEDANYVGIELLLKNARLNMIDNILRLFDVLPNVPLTTSESMGVYYL